MSSSHALSTIEPLIPSSTTTLLTPTSNERSHSPDTDRNLCVMLDDRGKVYRKYYFVVNPIDNQFSKVPQNYRQKCNVFFFSTLYIQNETVFNKHFFSSLCVFFLSIKLFRFVDALSKFD